MIKKMFKKVQGFSPVELVIMVGFGALAAAALIYLGTTPHYMASSTEPVNVNIKVDTPAPVVKTVAQAPVVSRTPSVSAYTIPAEGYGETLSRVKDEGLSIGFRVATLKGFVEYDQSGKRPVSGFEYDLAHALAAAIFGPSYNGKVDYSKVDGTSRFTSLDDGTVDVVFRTVTNTASRDTELTMGNGSTDGFNFAPTYYYDGQDILVPASTTSPSQMVIATQTGTVTTDDNILAWASTSGATVALLPFTDPVSGKTYTNDASGLVSAMLDGANYTTTQKVNSITNDSSALIGFRLGQLSGLSTKLWLKENNQPFLSKEPLAPMIREGDEQWNNIVRQVMYVLFEAEEEGVTQKTVQPGYKGSVGPKLGLDTNWAYNAIKVAGNFGEIWDANLSDPAWAPRGPNESWINGGLIYATPVK